METIYFQTRDGIKLEGLLHRAEKSPAAVITHPHPLFGGDMHNYVVSTIEEVFRDLGYTTLRFNFRGVGRSGGAHEDGKGEKQDVLSAIRYVKELGADRVELAGYSFGTWVNALAAADADIARMTMVSPPVIMMPFPESEIPALKLVVTGSHDEFAPPGQIRKLLAGWNPDAVLEVIDGGDHFYGTTLGQLRSLLEKYLS